MNGRCDRQWERRRQPREVCAEGVGGQGVGSAPVSPHKT